jgi:hypothetical protein
MWSPTTSGLYQTKIMVPSMVVLPSKFVYLFAVSLLILYGIILSSSMKLSLHFQDFRKVITPNYETVVIWCMDTIPR